MSLAGIGGRMGRTGALVVAIAALSGAATEAGPVTFGTENIVSQLYAALRYDRLNQARRGNL